MSPRRSTDSWVKRLALSLALGALVGTLFAGCNQEAFDSGLAAPTTPATPSATPR